MKHEIEFGQLESAQAYDNYSSKTIGFGSSLKPCDCCEQDADEWSITRIQLQTGGALEYCESCLEDSMNKGKIYFDDDMGLWFMKGCAK